MSKLKKPVWHEGALLTQQHFQQWNNYVEELAQHHWQLSPYRYGISTLEIDDSALQVGRFRILKCEAIFEKGQAISFDHQHDGELCFDLKQFENQIISVYLCTPFAKHIKGLTGYNAAAESYGWQAEYRMISDEYDPAREREVAFAKPHLFISNEDKLAHTSAIKIAEVEIVGHQQYALRTRFIPSCVQVSSSSVLSNFLNRMVHFLEAKANVLYERKDNYQSSLAQFGQTDFLHFLLLKSITQYTPLLKHYYNTQKAHPVDVYEVFIQLIGSLDVLTPSHTLNQVIQYDHDNLTEVFNKIETDLQTLIEQALPSSMQIIYLKKQTDAIYQADQIEEKLLNKHDFYLAVKHEDEEMSWVHRFVEQIKISNINDLAFIVGSAISGVHLNHVQRIPSSLPVKSGYEYFKLETQGDFWQKVRQVRDMALFVSNEFTSSTLEMIAVKD